MIYQKISSLSIDKKKQAAEIIAGTLIKALSEDLYPCEQSQAIFGIKMEKINSFDVKSMSTGVIVYNVWAGLFKNQMFDKKWLKQALLNGKLESQFEKKVYQLMEKASKQNCFQGNYMPELIQRGFDKIVWDKNMLNALKL